MSAQERAALIADLQDALGWDWTNDDDRNVPTAHEVVGDIADALLAAGWTRPVPAPDGDAIERAREALTTSAVLHDFGGQSDWDETPQHVTCECGEVFEAETVGRAQVVWHEHVIDEQVNVVRPLLASPVREPGRSEVEWGVRAVWDDGEVAEGPLAEPPNTAGAAREVCQTLIDEWSPRVRSAEVVSRVVGPWLPADQVTDTEGTKP